MALISTTANANSTSVQSHFSRPPISGLSAMRPAATAINVDGVARWRNVKIPTNAYCDRNGDEKITQTGLFPNILHEILNSDHRAHLRVSNDLPNVATNLGKRAPNAPTCRDLHNSHQRHNPEA